MKNKKILAVGLVWAVCMGLASSSYAKSLKEVQNAALHGDYQAQRNLAFGYTSMPYSGQQKNPVLACAWRIVILASDRADETDQGNYDVYCRKLSKEQYDIAKSKADRLAAAIDKNQR